MDTYALLLAASLNAGTVLALASLGLLVNEKVGIVNLGAEGMMLCAAIAGFACVVHTGNEGWGFLAGALAGALLAAVLLAVVLLPVAFTEVVFEVLADLAAFSALSVLGAAGLGAPSFNRTGVVPQISSNR